MEMSAPTKLPFSVLGEFAHGPATQPTAYSPAQLPAQPTETSASEANAEAVAVPIGVLEVPIGVWGSRRVETDSGEAERVEVFAEDTCTVIVFPQGAVIRLSASVAPGQLVVIANRKSGQIMLCRIVNVRTYPNIRGYAEIEFMHSATGFWGAYASQGILRLAAKVESAFPSASADFWSHGFAKEVVSVTPSDVIASSVAAAVRIEEEEPIADPIVQIPFGEPLPDVAAIRMDSAARLDAAARNSSNQHIVLAPASSPRVSSLRTSSPRPSIPLATSPLVSSPPVSSPPVSSQISARSRIASFLFSWWPKPTVRTAAYGAPVPRRSWVLVSLVPALVLLAVLGVYFLRDGVWQPSGIGQTAPMPEVSLGSPIAHVVQSPQPKSNASFVVPQLPIAKAENFPGAQIREFADNIRSSRPSGRRGTSEKKIPKEKLLAPYSSANRLASVGRELPPDVTRVDSNTGASPLQGVLATVQPLGGQAKAPQLLVSSAPIYPTMARQARVEGQVTIEAVIDATGKLTNMTVISGPPLLQQAAMDSLRTWKYQPGYLNEKPVPTKTSITVNFRLR
jgi:TonB family protein